MTTGLQREYAERIGATEAYVSKLKREGKIVMVETDAGPRVDFEATDALLLAARDPNREGVRARWHHEKAAAPATAGAPAARGAAAPRAGNLVTDPAAPGGSGADAKTEVPAPGENRELYDQRLRAQTRAAEIEADIKVLDLQERAGLLIRVADAEERNFVYGRMVRDMFLALPARVSSNLAAEMDPHKAARLLEDEIKATLNELSSRLVAESRSQRHAGGPGPAG